MNKQNNRKIFEDQNWILNDYLAIKFQGNRGYSAGLLPLLQRLEKQGKIELLKVKRLFFGSLYMEGYNTFVWKKVK